MPTEAKPLTQSVIDFQNCKLPTQSLCWEPPEVLHFVWNSKDKMPRWNNISDRSSAYSTWTCKWVHVCRKERGATFSPFRLVNSASGKLQWLNHCSSSLCSQVSHQNTILDHCVIPPCTYLHMQGDLEHNASIWNVSVVRCQGLNIIIILTPYMVSRKQTIFMAPESGVKRS